MNIDAKDTRSFTGTPVHNNSEAKSLPQKEQGSRIKCFFQDLFGSEKKNPPFVREGSAPVMTVSGDGPDRQRNHGQLSTCGESTLPRRPRVKSMTLLRGSDKVDFAAGEGSWIIAPPRKNTQLSQSSTLSRSTSPKPVLDADTFALAGPNPLTPSKDLVKDCQTKLNAIYNVLQETDPAKPYQRCRRFLENQVLILDESKSLRWVEASRSSKEISRKEAIGHVIGAVKHAFALNCFEFLPEGTKETVEVGELLNMLRDNPNSRKTLYSSHSIKNEWLKVHISNIYQKSTQEIEAKADLLRKIKPSLKVIFEELFYENLEVDIKLCYEYFSSCEKTFDCYLRFFKAIVEEDPKNELSSIEYFLNNVKTYEGNKSPYPKETCLKPYEGSLMITEETKRKTKELLKHDAHLGCIKLLMEGQEASIKDPKENFAPKLEEFCGQTLDFLLAKEALAASEALHLRTQVLKSLHPELQTKMISEAIAVIAQMVKKRSSSSRL